MRFSRLVPLLLSAALLTACAGNHPPPQEGILYRATGIPPDTVAFTVDRREVTAGQYFYALASACDGIQAAYQKADAAVDWGEMLSEQTLGDYAREQALASAALYATVENWAEQYGCTLSSEDWTELDAEWAQKAAEYGGEDAYLNALEHMGLDRDSARQLACDQRLYLRLYDLYGTEGSALYPDSAAIEHFAKSQTAASPDPAVNAVAVLDAYFDFLLQSAADGAEIVYAKAWNPPAVDVFYDKLTAARAALPEANP